MTPNKRLQRQFLGQIAFLLAIAGALSILFNEWGDNMALEQATLDRARAHFRDIVLTRRWNAEHGGVYVEKRAGVESSPYLSDTDITATNGKTYAQIVPAQMTREISKLVESDGDFRFHITGLILKNASNAPDAWEREALLAFGKGEKERSESVVSGNRTQFRYMAPLHVEPPCLKCHEDLGYKVGDVRGGISVSFDITPLLATQRRHFWLTGTVALLTVASLFLLARAFARRLDRRLQRLNRRHEDLVQSIDGIVWEAEVDPLRFTFISHEVENITGYPASHWMQEGFWAERIHPDDRPKVLAALDRCAAEKDASDIEYRIIARDGRFVWIHDRVNVVIDDEQPLLLRGLATDITARRQHDEQIQRLLVEKESILENALVGIVYLRHRRIVSCNRRFEEIFGYEAGEMIGESTRCLYEDEESFLELGAQAYAALGRGSSYSVETLLRRKDGRQFWGALTGRAIDPNEPQEGSIWIYADVSERRQAEEEVHKLLRAVEQSPVSIVITNRDGIIEYVNPRFTRVTGYTIDEAVGQNPRILQSGETPPEVYQELWEALLAGREWRGVLRNRRKSGELFWEEATISPIVNERLEITHFLAVKEDISERRQAENALRESHEAYLHLLETTLDGFLLLDTDGRVLDVNAAYIKQSGYRHDELLEMRIAELEAAQSPTDTSDRLPRIVFLSGDQFETVHRRKDGTLWDVEVSVSYRASAGGQFFVFLRDITARKEIQRQLENQQQHLEHLVQTRTADLAAALQAATVADKAKDAFLANVSHELRTPLNAVIGLSGLALRNAADDKQRDTLKKVIGSGETLLALVNDLLDLSKISAGEMRFESTQFSLRNVVSRVRSAMGVRAAEKSLQLSEEIDEDLPDLLIGDPLRVEQILLNLVSNAIKFTASGAVQLRIGMDARGEKMLRLRIEVADTGIGMTADEMARLFQPFAQADGSITRVHGGTGLGLAICKQLAEGMNGSIEVNSEPGSGSVFRVRLWLGVDHEGIAQTTAPAAESILPARYPEARVLVVDDQPLNREIVYELLATVGIVPQLAADGREALELIRSSGPGAFDLILMDIQMPVMDGLSATREIRALPDGMKLPIVAMTAHTMVHEKTAYLAAGMNDHIGKPFTIDNFFSLLARWLPHAAASEAAPPNPAAPLQPSGSEVRSTASEGVSGMLRSLPDLDVDAALDRLAGNLDRYCHWLSVFIAESPGNLSQMQALLDAGDRNAARMAAHAFKGRTGMLGMTAVHARATVLESAIRGDTETALLASPMADLAAVTLKMRTDLQGILGTASVTAPSAEDKGLTVPSGEMPEAIGRLINMLDSADGASTAALDRCLAEFSGSDWLPLLGTARPYVLRFEFAAAARLLATRGREQPEAVAPTPETARSATPEGTSS